MQLKSVDESCSK